MNVSGLLTQGRRAWEISRDQGPQYVLWVTLARLAQRLSGPGPLLDPQSGIDELLRQYRANSQHLDSVPKATSPKESLRIVWVVPLMGPGSGGMADIVDFASALSRRGHENTLCFPTGSRRPNVSRIERGYEEWYGQHGLGFRLLTSPADLAGRPPADVIVATAWPTAYIVNQWRGNAVPAYFVQDYEPWFYPQGPEALLADHTYAMDFQYITYGRWLQHELLERHGTASFAFDIPIDRRVFYPRSVQRSSKFRVAFYVRTATPRRSFALGIAALRSFAEQAGSDVEILLFGDPVLPHGTQFTNLGALSRDQLASLSSSVDVLLNLSATTMSRVSREAAACGAAIVELDLPGVRAHLTHGLDAYLAAPLPSTISDALLELYRDRDLCRRIAQGGQQAAQALPSWDDIVVAIEPVLRGESVLREEIQAP